MHNSILKIDLCICTHYHDDLALCLSISLRTSVQLYTVPRDTSSTRSLFIQDFPIHQVMYITFADEVIRTQIVDSEILANEKWHLLP
jgi:hypothetical protein